MLSFHKEKHNILPSPKQSLVFPLLHLKKKKIYRMSVRKRQERFICQALYLILGFPNGSVVKNPPAMQKIKETGSIPGLKIPWRRA